MSTHERSAIKVYRLIKMALLHQWLQTQNWTIIDINQIKIKTNDNSYITNSVFRYRRVELKQMVISLDLDDPTVLKISFLASIDLVTSKLFLICIAPFAQLTLELEDWYLHSLTGVVSWQCFHIVLPATKRYMLRIV